MMKNDDRCNEAIVICRSESSRKNCFSTIWFSFDGFLSIYPHACIAKYYIVLELRLFLRKIVLSLEKQKKTNKKRSFAHKRRSIYSLSLTLWAYKKRRGFVNRLYINMLGCVPSRSRKTQRDNNCPRVRTILYPVQQYSKVGK